MMPPRRHRRQLWLIPPAFFGIIVFILPFLTCRYLPQESKLHQELSSFHGDNHDEDEVPSQSQSTPDGTFNGVPLYYRNDSQKFSSVHCIGETFQPQPKHPWIHRSCHYQHLCFDLEEQDFVLFQSPEEQRLQTKLRKHEMMHVSTLLSKGMNDNAVSIGGINTKWTWRKHGVPRLKWSPRVLPANKEYSYYEMNATWIPFHSMAGFNPGHLVWDDWLPIYTLLSMFQVLGNNNENDDPLLLMRYVLPGKGMWATCDFNIINKERCRQMFAKFLPLMGIQNNSTTQFTTNQNYQLNENIPNRTRYVCAKQGLAGIAMLTDHGNKQHGWDEADFKWTHNHARGRQLYDFRQFMIQNVLGKDADEHAPSLSPPYKIIFSTNSSKSTTRGMGFERQIQLVQSSFPKECVEVQALEFKTLSLQEQVRIASETSIFITVCGGGAVTATFLPKGASVILYFDATGGAKDNVYTGQPARLDWDLFENFASVSTHWLPTGTMDSGKDLQILLDVLQHELDRLQQL